MENKQHRVLVCITAQSNSKRLMDCGYDTAEACGGELHILHVLEGDSVFNNPDTPALLQNLFDYGAKKGGVIHAYCDNNVPESIGRFAEKEKITKIILGEPPKEKDNPINHFKSIVKTLPDGIEIIILDRNVKNGTRSFKKNKDMLAEVL